MMGMTVEFGNESVDGVNEWRRDDFDARGARAFDMVLEREYRAAHAATDWDRAFWSAAAGHWRARAMTWWTYAAECAAAQAGT